MRNLKPLEFELPRTHAEMAALRLLVEALFTALPPVLRDDAMQAFANSCAAMTFGMQRDGQKEALVNVMEVAIAQQMRRLAGAGLVVPQPTEPQQRHTGPERPSR